RAGGSSYRLVSTGQPCHYRGVWGRLGGKRLLTQAGRQLLGRKVASTRARHDIVLAVEPVGVQELIAITTSTRTLVVEGLLSHNSYPSLDIANLTREDAIAIYYRDWWQRYGYDRLHDDAVATKLLDMAVNMGPATAHRLLQGALVFLGYPVAVDGIIGPQTIAAANKADPKRLLQVLRWLAARHYYHIAARHPQSRAFLVGWLTRAYS